MGQQCPKHFGGGVRPGLQRPARLCLASDPLMLCPELSHYGLRGSVSTPYRFPSSLMTSVPDHRTNPSLCPGTSVSSYSDKVRPWGCTVLLVGLHHSALFICVIIFLKIVLPVVATPVPQP